MSKIKPAAAKTAAPTKPQPKVAAKRPAPKAAPARAATVAKSVAKVPAVKPAAKGGVSKPAKPIKIRQKPVRDSFTMPEGDFALIAALKARLLAARRETKKSELLRAGLHVLAGLDTSALAAVLGKLDPVKVGRPKKSH